MSIHQSPKLFKNVLAKRPMTNAISLFQFI
nr:MAG TPA: hypothetical protein [Caudoviricetes sp.]